jgi:hypothetical protein
MQVLGRTRACQRCTRAARAVRPLRDVRVLRDSQGLDLDREPRTRTADDDTFATANSKTALTAALTAADPAVVSATKTASLAIARALLPAPVAETAGSWLSGDHPYRLGVGSRPLDKADQQLVGALDPSQADMRLDAHVAARARETRHR